MLVNRIGTFLILLGVLLISLFIISDVVDAPSCNLLVYGAISLAVGIFLWFRNPAPPPPETGRFRLFRKSAKKPAAKK